MAEIDPGTVPPVPTNPFSGGGTEKNIDQQRALLNDLIANQGQAGKAIYARQAPEAQDMLAQRLAAAGQVPDARKAVYDAFTRDAQAADQQQVGTQQRQNQLGQLFMEQAKAAVPIYAKNVDATTEAMRQQFELRRQQEADQAAAQQASARASARASLSGAALGSEKAQQDLAYWKAVDPDGQNPNNPLTKGGVGAVRTTEQAAKDGTAQPVKTFEQATEALNLPSWQKLSKTYPGLQEDANQIQSAINGMATKKGAQALTFDDVYAALQAVATDDTLKSPVDQRQLLIDVLLGANAGRWGVNDPNEWSYNPGRYQTLREAYSGRGAR